MKNLNAQFWEVNQGQMMGVSNKHISKVAVSFQYEALKILEILEAAASGQAVREQLVRRVKLL